MKPITTLILAASLSAAASLIAAQEEAAKEEATPSASAKTDASGKLLQMNFRDASLEQVLNYLSEAAGFIINVKPGTSIRGKVTVMSSEPLTKEEAVSLLNTVLNENNLAALERGRILTIMPRDEIKIAGIPVMSGSDPDKIPITDRIVTQIMPVRFVEAAQLLKDLQPLVSIQTTMTANEAGNEILMTDTQANIHKVAEIIKAIDAGAEDFSMLKVFSLTNADPTEMADMLTQLFADDSNQRGGNQSGFSNPFFGRFGRLAALSGRGGGQSSQGSNSQNQRIKKRNRVVAYADQRTASVVVSASRDLMDEIEDVVHTLDDNRKGKKTVSMFDISGTDPAEIYPVLQELFQKYQTSSSSRNAAGSTSALSTRSSQGSSQTGSTGSSTSRTGMGQSSRGLGSGGGGGLSFP